MNPLECRQGCQATSGGQCVGMQSEWDTWPPEAQRRLGSVGRNVRLGEAQHGENYGRHPGKGGEYKPSGSQGQQEAWNIGCLYGEGSWEMVTSPSWSCSVPEGQCLRGEWLGPSTPRCPRTHTANQITVL